jgi:hypothetical protein
MSDEVEQATAAPGEKRSLPHEPTVICASCGQAWPCSYVVSK